MTADVAIVGAGMAGLACARALTDAGRSVVLFDKGRKAGGRLSTRRADATGFDHGAPLFTTTSPDFEVEVEGWAEAGFVARWRGRFATVGPGGGRRAWTGTAWVGVPTMSSIPAALAENLDVHVRARVGSIEREDGTWSLTDEDGRALGCFGTVLVNTPCGQAGALLTAVPPLSEAAGAVQMDPCWTAMVIPENPWDPGFDCAEFEAGPLSRASAQASKPGRDGTPGWVLHARGDWTRAHWDAPARTVLADLVVAASEAAGVPMGPLRHAQSHRWRYARAGAGLPEACLWDADAQVGACGDWCGGPGLEGAWRSGVAMARRVLATS